MKNDMTLVDIITEGEVVSSDMPDDSDIWGIQEVVYAEKLWEKYTESAESNESRASPSIEMRSDE